MTREDESYLQYYLGNGGLVMVCIAHYSGRVNDIRLILGDHIQAFPWE